MTPLDQIKSPEMEKKQTDMSDKLWMALIVVALAIGGAVAFKYVMTGVLVLAAILEMAMYLLFRNQSSVLREYVMIGVFLAAAMAGIVVYFGHRFFNGINCGAHACDPVPDVVVVGEPAGTNIVKPASTNNVVPTVGTPEQLSQTGSKTP